ncbi:hypothetical protein [Mycobacterium riyadhense]|nr:hypothetical protein [Mycobacterium riyadhense]
MGCGFGPAGFDERRGHVKLVKSNAQPHDEERRRRLWIVSESTGVSFGV